MLPAAAAAGAPAVAEDRILYYPTRERVLDPRRQLERRHALEAAGHRSFPALLEQVRYGLILTDTPLVDKDGNSKGTLLPEASRVTLLESGDWMRVGIGLQHALPGAGSSAAGSPSRVDRLVGRRADPRRGQAAWPVGIMPRKIVIGGGESEYSLLVIADGGT